MKDTYFIKNKKQLLIIGFTFTILNTLAFLSLLFYYSTTQITRIFNQSTPLSMSICSNFHSYSSDIEVDKVSYNNIYSKYHNLLDNYTNNPNIEKLLYDYYIYDSSLYFGKNLQNSDNYQCYMFDGFSLTLKDNYLDEMTKDFSQNMQFEFVTKYYTLSKNTDATPVFMFNPLVVGINNTESSIMLENNIQIIKGRNVNNSNEIVVPNNMMLINKKGSKLVNIGDIIPLAIELNDSIEEMDFLVVGKHNGNGIVRTDINSMEIGIPLSEIVFINRDAFNNIQSKIFPFNNSVIVRKIGGISTPLIQLKNNKNLINTISTFKTDIENLSMINNVIYFKTSTNINENIHFLTTLRQFNTISGFLLFFCCIAYPFIFYIVNWISLHQRKHEFSVLLSMGLSLKRLKQIILKSYISILLCTVLIAIIISQLINYIFINYLNSYLSVTTLVNINALYLTNIVIILLSTITIFVLITIFIRNIINTMFKSSQLKELLSN